MYKLSNVDCLELLSEIPDNSIGHINCDPPYNIGYDKWDHFPSEDAYLDWCHEWITECARVLKPGRMMCVWGTQKTDLFFRLKLEVMNHLEGMVSQPAIHWTYNWGGRTRTNFAHKMETAWCFSKGKDFHFDRSNIEVERILKTNLRTGKPFENGTIPTTVWDCTVGKTSEEFKESRFHPTAKPQKILQRMIYAYTEPGETVLDCFSGSGSTAVAALQTGRDFIGCELDTEYFEQSLARIEKHANTLEAVVNG